MIELLIDYSFFLLKVVTIVIVIILPLLIISSANRHKKFGEKGHLIIKNLSERLDKMGTAILSSEMDKKSFKKFIKDKNKKKKKEKSPDQFMF